MKINILNLNSSQLADIAERVVWTFIQTFAGVLLAGNVLDIVEIQSAAQIALTASIASLLSLVKNLASTQLGLGSGATLPRTLESEPNGRKKK